MFLMSLNKTDKILFGVLLSQNSNQIYNNNSSEY